MKPLDGDDFLAAVGEALAAPTGEFRKASITTVKTAFGPVLIEGGSVDGKRAYRAWAPCPLHSTSAAHFHGGQAFRMASDAEAEAALGKLSHLAGAVRT